jgi:hypothetical protein
MLLNLFVAKKIGLAAAIATFICLLLVIAGCGTGQPSANSPDSGPTPATTEKQAAPAKMVKAIVFDGTTKIEDEEGTYNITLYETSPGVFSGKGFRCGVWINDLGDYRQVGHYFFRGLYQDMKPGEKTAVYSNGYFEDYEWQSRVYNVHTTQILLFDLEALPSDWCTRYTIDYPPGDYTLSIDGDKAILSTENDKIEGIVAELPLPDALDMGLLDGNCMSIYSQYSENNFAIPPKDKDRLLHYQALFTAKRTNGYDFSGNLCVYGTADGGPYVDEDVRFSMSPFNPEAYKEAGGALPYSFDSFGIINTSAGSYIISADKAGILLEPVGSNLVFGGKLVPEEQYENEKHVAEDTKPIMYALYNGMKKSAIGPLTGIKDVAPWYKELSGWFLPTVSYYKDWTYQSFHPTSLNPNFNTTFLDNSNAFAALVETYTQKLSVNDGYELFIDPNAKQFVNIKCKKGTYSIYITMNMHGPFPGAAYVNMEIK